MLEILLGLLIGGLAAVLIIDLACMNVFGFYINKKDSKRVIEAVKKGLRVIGPDSDILTNGRDRSSIDYISITGFSFTTKWHVWFDADHSHGKIIPRWSPLHELIENTYNTLKNDGDYNHLLEHYELQESELDSLSPDELMQYYIDTEQYEQAEELKNSLAHERQ